jgi:hypothetical protein
MDKENSLEVFLQDVRRFLEPIWVKTHKSWDDEPMPDPPSKYMCRYSCLFLQQLLQQYGYGQWSIELGRPPSPDLNGTKEGKFGYYAKDGWYDHAWLVKDGVIIDITADQYGDAPIIISSITSSKYNANLSEDNAAMDLKKLKKRAVSWIDMWSHQTVCQ